MKPTTQDYTIRCEHRFNGETLDRWDLVIPATTKGSARSKAVATLREFEYVVSVIPTNLARLV